jgi:uncharacterized ParB-like nuclease family protein
MGNLPNIENITNLLLTIQKIKHLYEPKTRSENKDSEDAGFHSASAGYINPDKLSLMQDILSAVSSLTPQMRGPSYGAAFSCCNRYSNTYRELKRQIRGMNRSNFEPSRILEIMKLVTPILQNRQKVFMDKTLKIIEILQT